MIQLFEKFSKNVRVAKLDVNEDIEYVRLYFEKHRLIAASQVVLQGLWAD